MNALAADLRDARRRTLQTVEGLGGEQWLGPRLPIVNPLRWELGHLAWFQEKWLLRRGGRPSILPGADALYDSSAIPHDVRWDLPLPSIPRTLDYLEAVLRRVLAGLARNDPYFARLALYHEDMHAEAFTYTRQTHGWTEPPGAVGGSPRAGPCPGDVELPGGRYRMGARRGLPFVFDNELEGRTVTVAPFRMARGAVSNAEFAEFVDAGGYREDRWWSREGLAWRRTVRGPAYWSRERSGRWLERRWGRWLPLEPDRAVIHVNAHEADAYCRWAGRRLPTEAEWEYAASDGGRRLFPWGDAPPTPERANLDARAGWTVDVNAHPAGDSAHGVRQLVGNAWEWCADAFLPYPGFRPGPYREYSEPWFGTHRVLRGGAWPTRGRLIRSSWRNFYTPDRRDVLAGFRTCALPGRRR